MRHPLEQRVCARPLHRRDQEASHPARDGQLVGLGVDAARLEVVAMGSSDPLNGDASDRAGSRRVEFYKK